MVIKNDIIRKSNVITQDLLTGKVHDIVLMKKQLTKMCMVYDFVFVYIYCVYKYMYMYVYVLYLYMYTQNKSVYIYQKNDSTYDWMVEFKRIFNFFFWVIYIKHFLQ